MKVLEIDKNNLKHNINLVKAKLEKENPNTKIYAVVKANGVGLGIIEYTNFLKENGINSFAVACIDEALKLRQANIEDEILMLSPTAIKNELHLLVQNDITLTDGSLNEISI